MGRRKKSKKPQEPPPPPPPKQRIPPIVLRQNIHSKELVEELKEATGGKFLLQSYPQILKVVQLETVEARDAVIALLKKKDVELHTYGLRSERRHKFVLLGMPSTASERMILSELKKTFPGVVSVKRAPNTPLEASFIVTTNNTVKLGDLKGLERVSGLQVRFSKCSPDSNKLQCFRCQNFGHGSRHCHQKQRCVRCAGPHAVKQCSKKNPVKCANCEGDHTASYRKCEARTKYLDRRPKTAKTPLDDDALLEDDNLLDLAQLVEKTFSEYRDLLA